jgi:hypothetical protein
MTIEVLFVCAFSAVVLIGVFKFVYEMGLNNGIDKENERCRKVYKSHLVKIGRAKYVVTGDEEGVHAKCVLNKNSEELVVDFSRPFYLS